MGSGILLVEIERSLGGPPGQSYFFSRVLRIAHERILEPRERDTRLGMAGTGVQRCSLLEKVEALIVIRSVEPKDVLQTEVIAGPCIEIFR